MILNYKKNLKTHITAQGEIIDKMSRKTGSATARLKQDYMRLKKDPVPYVQAEPIPSNILEW